MGIEGRPGTALVVDDDPALREMEGFFLETAGLEDILVAEGPDEALAIVRDRLTADLPPPDRKMLVVTDIRMPNPRDGINMLRKFIELGWNEWIKQALLVTGTPEDVTPDDITAIQNAGVPVAVLKKPFGITEFTSAVARLQNG